jgi:hypothetical protein
MFGFNVKWAAPALLFTALGVGGVTIGLKAGESGRKRWRPACRQARGQGATGLGPGSRNPGNQM